MTNANQLLKQTQSEVYKLSAEDVEFTVLSIESAIEQLWSNNVKSIEDAEKIAYAEDIFRRVIGHLKSLKT